MHFIQLLSAFPFAILMGGVLFFFLRRFFSVPSEYAISITGILLFLLFLVGVSVPFYFQGYAKDLEKCAWYLTQLNCPAPPAAIPRGWSGLAFVDPISYFLSGQIGVAILVLCILSFSFGTCSRNKYFDYSIRTFLIIAVSISLWEFHKYSVINWALE
jgi:hypothetical protein